MIQSAAFARVVGPPAKVTEFVDRARGDAAIDRGHDRHFL